MAARKQISKAVKAPLSSQTQADARPDSFHDLEGELCDVTNMAGILCDMVEALVTQKPPVRLGETHVFCNEDDRHKLAYAAHETAEQLLALKARFYRIYEGDNEQKRAAKGGGA